ncbi:MAG: transcriptional regulator, partial [Bacteroidetes bacterium]|nr:transcriptional regulator [Bacteroidota bacterium]
MQDTMQVLHLIKVIFKEMTREELQEKLQIKNRDYFRKSYILEALNKGYIEMTIPGKPNSKNQKYCLTAKGKALQKQIKL